MREDQASSGFAFQRMREVVDNTLLCQSEQLVSALRHENVVLKEQLIKAKALNADRSMMMLKQGSKLGQPEGLEKYEGRIKSLKAKKDKYKQVAHTLNQDLKVLLSKVKEHESKLEVLKKDYELKVATKDGEIIRLEKSLSEAKSHLHDKSF